jgi:predicted anti-sigma-YlaC factor YlaD
MERVAAVAVGAVMLAATGCSIKGMAVNSLADVLGEADAVYLSDNDPELVAAALPFNLKTIEMLLATSPDHRGLLLTATTAFVLYGYGFVEPEADYIEDDDWYRAEEIRGRAHRLYMRAYRYGLRGLDVAHPDFSRLLPIAPAEAIQVLGPEDLELTVWTAAALGAAIGAATDKPDATADIGVVGALLEWALEIDETYDNGTIHAFLVSYETGRVGGSVEQARAHYQRALELSAGGRASIYLSWAESVCVAEQDRAAFVALVQQVIDYQVDAYPEGRLLNILAQRRARWLMSRTDELFLKGGER